VLLQAHSAPVAISFYAGAQFPHEFNGDAFVALHGSWNRTKKTGFKVVRLKFVNGHPTGEYQDFVTGFVIDNTHIWGRPSSIAVMPDGALLVAEDANGEIWRISYTGHK
jgi:glucose/arabinose dehydrogenase